MQNLFRYFILINFILLNYLISNAQLTPVKYNDGNQILNGLISYPTKQLDAKPGILILPAWMGIDTHAKVVAAELSSLGYYSFVADIYGENNYPSNRNEAGQQAGYYKSHINEYRKRIKLALDELIKSGADPDYIIVIGYCFGGTGALEAARNNLPVKGIVSFHGGLSRDTTYKIEKIIPKILVCHGADDFFISQEEINAFQQEMRDSQADWQMVFYANAVHAFTDPNSGNDNSKGVAYNEKAAKRSWKLMLQFLDEVLFQSDK